MMEDEDWDSPVESSASASGYGGAGSSSRGYHSKPPSRGRQFGRGRGFTKSQPLPMAADIGIDASWGDVADFVPKKKPARRRPGPNEPFAEVYVPSGLVGKIIGRGGSKIEELQAESEALIVIDKQTNGAETVVKVYGNEDQTAKAKDLIDKIINGGGQGASGGGSKSSPLPEIDIDAPIDWAALNERCERARAERWAALPPLTKQFYQEDVEVANFTPDQVEKIRAKNNNIVVSRVFEEKHGYKKIPNPVVTFDQAFSNFPEILDEIKKAGFTTPSPIQCQAWPVLLSGEDLIGIAQTGTGKTLAFLLPALIHIDGQNVPMSERGGPNVLVLAPTRELALQIKREVDKYQYRGIKAVCLYGGGDRREQVNAVAKGVQIIIATPGRLNDLVMCELLKISSVTYLVLDEADRMLDMGFEPQIRKILLDIRPDRQTVMTSATWPSGVRRLAESYMDNPVQVYVGSLDLAAVHSVTQTVVVIDGDEDEKYQMLMEWIGTMAPDDKAIIFCGKKTRADHISSELVMMGIDCQSIHGDRDQSDREQALVDIANGSVKILVATDVASRGLDIQDITHVVNYDFPRNIEEYVHRVGRTGRAGRTGESITYMTKQDWGNARELIKILEEADQEVPAELEAMAERYEAMRERRSREGGFRGGRGSGGYGGGGSSSGGYGGASGYGGGRPGSSRQSRW